MSELFVSVENAENDLLACAAYIGERIKSSDGHAEAMNAIVPRYLAGNEVDLAAELANAVDDPFSRDKLLTAVAVKCAEIDDDEYALQLADAIEDLGLRSQAFERVGLVKAEKGAVEKAAEIADAMAHPDFVLAAVAVRQAADGDRNASEATISKIEFPSARVSAMHQIAARMIEDKKVDDAVAILDGTIASAEAIEHDEERIRAFLDIGNHFLEAERKDRAIETFDKSRGYAEALQNAHRDFFLVNCALGFLYAGSIELADRTLDLVTDKTQIASALLGFAREYWKNGEKDEAVDTITEAYEIVNSQRESETRDSRGRVALIASIAAQFAGFGKSDRGIEIALQIPDVTEQTAALSQIAQIQTMLKDDGQARQTIEMIAEDSDRLLAFVAISDEKTRQGETEAAIDLLNEAASMTDAVSQPGARSTVLNEIAARFTPLGLPERSRELALENLKVIAGIRDESSQAASLAALSDIYAVAGIEIGDDERQVLGGLARKFEF